MALRIPNFANPLNGPEEAALFNLQVLSLPGQFLWANTAGRSGDVVDEFQDFQDWLAKNYPYILVGAGATVAAVSMLYHAGRAYGAVVGEVAAEGE